MAHTQLFDSEINDEQVESLAGVRSLARCPKILAAGESAQNEPNQGSTRPASGFVYWIIQNGRVVPRTPSLSHG